MTVWDTGTWEPVHTDDAAAAVEAGELHGQKLRGRLVLVRRGEGQDWMLLHKRDEHAVKGWDPEDHPASVLSGRTNDEVKEDPARLWHAGTPAAEAAESLVADTLPDSALDDLEAMAEPGAWEVFGRRLKVTNLDKPLFPGDPPVTKRQFPRLHRADRAGRTPLSGRPRAQPAPLPRRRRAARLLAQAVARACPGLGRTVGQPGG